MIIKLKIFTSVGDIQSNILQPKWLEYTNSGSVVNKFSYMRFYDQFQF